jgi:hypothetical protein
MLSGLDNGMSVDGSSFKVDMRRLDVGPEALFAGASNLRVAGQNLL